MALPATSTRAGSDCVWHCQCWHRWGFMVPRLSSVHPSALPGVSKQVPAGPSLHVLFPCWSRAFLGWHRQNATRGWTHGARPACSSMPALPARHDAQGVPDGTLPSPNHFWMWFYLHMGLWEGGKTRGHFAASLLVQPSSTCLVGWRRPRREAVFLPKHCITPAAGGSKRCGSQLGHTTVDKSTSEVESGPDILHVCFSFFFRDGGKQTKTKPNNYKRTLQACKIQLQTKP